VKSRHLVTSLISVRVRLHGDPTARGRFPVLRDMCSRDDLNEPYLVWPVTGDSMSALATVAKLRKEFSSGKKKHLTETERDALLLLTFGFYNSNLTRGCIKDMQPPIMHNWLGLACMTTSSRHCSGVSSD